jgi:hypothetical protein
MKSIRVPTFISSFISSSGPFAFAWILAVSIPKGFTQLTFWDSLLMQFAIYIMIAGSYAGISWILVRDRTVKVRMLRHFIEVLVLLAIIAVLGWVVSGKPLWLVIPISLVTALIGVTCITAGGGYVVRKCGQSRFNDGLHQKR